MSSLNINKNVFLEREELLRFQEFMSNSPAANVFLGNTLEFGVVKTDFVTNRDFLIEVGSNVGTIKMDYLSKALDKNKSLIYQEPINNISVIQDSNWYWVKISQTYRIFEEGTVSVDINGNLVGLGTKFTEILRGQSTKVPTRIKFYKESGFLLNRNTYEVLGIKDDLSCVLQGDFVAESDIRYVVLGSVAIGETITSQIEEGLYKYDGCNIELIAEEIEDTPPTTNFVEGEQFYLARVKNNLGELTIEDKRQFWKFQIEGISDKLDKNPSLWSFTEAQKNIARNNLDIYSKLETAELLNVTEIPWTAMTKGNGLATEGFDVKIRRIGKYINITGKFTTSALVNENDILFEIAYSTIGTLAAPSNIIRGQEAAIENDSNHTDSVHGLRWKINPPVTVTDTLQVLADVNNMPQKSIGDVFNINIMYIAG